MDDDDDADLVKEEASKFIARSGKGAVADLRNRAEIAAAQGDDLSAEVWTEIADAAEALLADEGRLTSRPVR
jgi:hypothetical protein